MPVKAVGNKLVEVESGEVVGHSKNPETAQAAARVKNAIHFSNRRPKFGPKRLVTQGGVDRQ